jgi:hypothetical protein
VVPQSWRNPELWTPSADGELGKAFDMTPNWTSDATVRRLGLRHELPNLLVATVERRRASRWRKPEQLEIAIADVSTTGVGFYGPDSPVLVVREPVIIRIDGTETEVRVRRADEGVDGEVIRYGAEFVEGFPALVALVEEKYSLSSRPDVPPRD